MGLHRAHITFPRRRKLRVRFFHACRQGPTLDPVVLNVHVLNVALQRTIIRPDAGRGFGHDFRLADQQRRVRFRQQPGGRRQLPGQRAVFVARSLRARQQLPFLQIVTGLHHEQIGLPVAAGSQRIERVVIKGHHGVGLCPLRLRGQGKGLVTVSWLRLVGGLILALGGMLGGRRSRC